jgi:hypothetical protein
MAKKETNNPETSTIENGKSTIENEGADETKSGRTEEEEKAEQLMEANGINEVYKVGKYWFTRKDYAESSAKKSGEEVIKYELADANKITHNS